MRAAAARARDALQKIISSPGYARALQEPIITMRSDRYVVPVKADHKGAVPGLVHDISASGMTLFIEPMAAVKANNELRELAAKEKLEIERILAELSADCAEHRNDINSDYEVLVRLDLKLFLGRELAQLVVGLDGRHRLDKERHARGGDVVHESRHGALVVCLDRDDIAVRAHGNDRLLQGPGIAGRGDDLLQRVARPRGRRAHIPPDRGEICRGAVRDLIFT